MYAVIMFIIFSGMFIIGYWMVQKGEALIKKDLLMSYIWQINGSVICLIGAMGLIVLLN